MEDHLYRCAFLAVWHSFASRSHALGSFHFSLHLTIFPIPLYYFFLCCLTLVLISLVEPKGVRVCFHVLTELFERDGALFLCTFNYSTRATTQRRPQLQLTHFTSFQMSWIMKTWTANFLKLTRQKMRFTSRFKSHIHFKNKKNWWEYHQ